MALVNSVNPVRIEGQKTAAFEIVDALGDAPDIHVLPVGNAGNITAYWKGYKEYAADGLATRTPRMWGFQASGSAPIVRGEVVKDPHDHRHRDPHRQPRLLAVRAGRAGRVRRLHRRGDGPSDPAPPTGCWPRRRASSWSPPRPPPSPVCSRPPSEGKVDPGQRIVCTVTGNGLKDPDWAVAGAPQPVTVPVDAVAAAERLGLV